MAERIPTYQPQAESRPLPTPYDDTRVTPESQGAPAGRSLQEVGSFVGEIAQHAKANADASAILGAIGQAKDALHNRILDPEKGYASLKGDDALAGHAKALATFNKEIDDIGGTLTNDAQRRAFLQHALTIREQGFEHATRHETTEIEHVQLAKFQGAADATERLLQAPQVITNPTARDQQLSDLLRISTAEALRRYGRNASPEAVQSVVGPVMQKAAVDAMEAATSPTIPGQQPDPVMALGTFQRVGPLLGVHERHYATLVARIQQDANVKTQARAIVAAAITPVSVPGGQVVPRLDEVKTAAGLAALPPDAQNLPEIAKAVSQQEATLGKLWTAAAGGVADRVHSAGYDHGVFDIDSPRIAVADKVFLQQNAPGEWDKLVALDQRVARMNSADTREASKQALAGLDISLNDPANREHYLGMTATEFNSQARGLSMLPADLISASDRYRKFVENANKNLETPNATVTRVIKAALPNSPIEQERLHEPVLDAVTKWREQWMQATGGKAPRLGELQDFINAEIARGAVGGTGSIFQNALIEERVRRIDFERGAGYRGATFTPSNPQTPVIPQPPIRTAAPAPLQTGPGGAPTVERKFVRGPDGKLVEVK